MHGRMLSVTFLLISFCILPAHSLWAQSSGPLLVVNPSPVDFDTVFCGSTRCIDVEFRNAGDTALTVHEFSPLAAPFQGSVQTPFVLQPGETHSVPWCYSPTRVIARDSVSARFTADNRIPYSFGLLFDASDEMKTAFPGAASAIAAAHDAMTDFIGTMMEDGSPRHEAAVFAYSTSSQFRLLRALDTSRNLIQGSIPGSASGAMACLWSGMDRSISMMQTARSRQVLIVVNASEDAGVGNCGPYSAPGVASAALAANMLVYSISINGAASTALTDIAQQTGGLHHNVASAAELAQALSDIRLHLQRAVVQELIVRGEVVSPSLAFTSDALLFPTTLVGETADSDLWIKNIGTAPMEIESINGTTAAFDIELLKSVILPGDSLQATVHFHPTDQMYNTAAISMSINGCVSAMPTLQLRGMSYLPANPSIGPVLSVDNPRIDFGQVPCNEVTDLTIPLRNTGDAVLWVGMPIIQSTIIPPPSESEWNIGAGSESEILLLKQPFALLGPDSTTVSAAAITRVSTSTVIVYDAGNAMRLPWQGTDGSGASKLAVGTLLGALANTPDLEDRLGIVGALKDGASQLAPMTKDKAILAALPLTAGNNDTTSLLQAIGIALDTLSNASGIRRLIILTAGSTESTVEAPSVRELADRVRADDILVSAFDFGRGAFSDSLAAFLTAAGTAAAAVADPDDVPVMTGVLEAQSIDTIWTSWVLRWTSVSSDISAAPDVLDFPESHPRAISCAAAVIRNPGVIPLEIHSVSGPSGLSSTTSLPLNIAAGDSAELKLCYQPEALGPWSVEAEIRSNSCIHPSISIGLRGIATDSNTISISGDVVVRPGGIVSIPLELAHAVPASYGVGRLQFSIGYDPSLLYPDMELPLLYTNGSAFQGAVSVTQDYDNASGLAVSSYDLQANPIAVMGSGPIPYLSLRLRAFLGRSLQTDVVLLSSALPGSEVALGFAGKATVRIDSMCWLEERLVNATALWGSLGKNAPNPSPGSTRITYSLNGDYPVRLTLYDMHGRLLRIIDEAERSAGSYSSTIDTHGLSAGAYICRLESSAGVLSSIVLVSNQEGK